MKIDPSKVFAPARLESLEDRDAALGRLMSSDLKERGEAAHALGVWLRRHTDDDAAASALARMLEAETEGHVAIIAARALSRIPRPEHFRSYVRAMRENPSMDTRKWLVAFARSLLDARYSATLSLPDGDARDRLARARRQTVLEALKYIAADDPAPDIALAARRVVAEASR